MIKEEEESKELSEVEEKHHVKPGEKPLSRSKTKNTLLKKRRAKKSITCTQCGKSFSTKQSLDVHMRIHTGEKPFTCDQCGKDFTTIYNLEIHMRIHTDMIKEEEESKELSEVEEKHHVKPGEKPLSRSKTKNTLLKKRRAKKSITCTQCGKSFSTKQSLDVHMRIHTGEKPFTCDQCGKDFTTIYNLEIHMRIHTANCKRSFAMADFVDDYDLFVADPEPYLFEPEYTEEELALMDREREKRYEPEQTGAGERTRANSNWWCKCDLRTDADRN
ncbi:Oocyte zinc finger protein XlCOF20 [Anabarilius grahami]|uniref:Oocyte zinc finger protein XlCOF20 n=1 Tax=Anabarilius grahami TaxID=495550 RepID=A0A3N0Y599_ANAGA|nr:Oocyte zinc finger protein XlCOF20 [Anabarilius grahami]